jgi:hypothetical protein
MYDVFTGVKYDGIIEHSIMDFAKSLKESLEDRDKKHL